jgi:hypothetical protein
MRLNQRLAICGLAAALCVHVGTLAAQDAKADSNTERRPRGNFDPAQFQQRMLENIKNQLAFTNDAEWAVVQPLVQKVMDARRETMSQGMGPGRMGRRPSDGGAGNPPGGEARVNPAFKSNPEVESLQKVIEDKAPAAEIKTALEKYRAARKDKETKLATAQENLRKVLTVRQEAQAALLGLVP